MNRHHIRVEKNDRVAVDGVAGYTEAIVYRLSGAMLIVEA